MSKKEGMLKNLADLPGLFDLAKLAGMSHCKLNRRFKELFGNTVFGCLREMRLEKARQLLTAGDMNVTEISYAVGYSCLSHFSKALKKYHISPRRCRKRFLSLLTVSSAQTVFLSFFNENVYNQNQFSI